MNKGIVKGIAASDGYAIAPVYVLKDPDLSFETEQVSDSAAEIERFKAAVAQSREEVQRIQEQAKANLSAEELQVFDAHLMFLADPEYVGQIELVIESEKINAEAALQQVSTMFITMFESMTDNAYMQERAADIRDVSQRILASLLGVELASPAAIAHEAILVAEDLTPSDTSQLNKQFVKAFVTNIGGRTSHSAIMARSLEIPAIVGTKTITEEVQHGDLVIVDAHEGMVILNPTEQQVEEYQQKMAKEAEFRAELETLLDAESTTKDGHQVEVAANIGTPKDMAGVLKNGAEGVGLYRTEFLYMDSADFPTEEEQYDAYKTVLEQMDGKPVVVRTMDIGGDKELDYLDLPDEMNPFLGYRAIRISLDQTEMFKTQLRALLRASVHGLLRIMFPMIATVDEFRQAKAIYEEVKAELDQEGIAYADTIQLGIMIEIPAAALMADHFAKEVDFFSIGTNDLIQYSMAADRMNERVSNLYQPYNPAILRLIKFVIDNAHAEGKWVGMCGEMGGDPVATPLLLGMGLDEFSMSAGSVLRIRHLIRNANYADCQALVERALTECASSEDVVKLLNEFHQ
ncbi:phosphoenolpyruvate--protein phosphotransferase [Falseniella ignava]|uniref:Phosphoenolpyruvate-protein phosphotransferase n=1 Tax=Falseniella ignava CCUG 37419 TaxID=883112 RepID=K1MIN7_9LACT|nr:phosphoenolpyruvate--protein phosphotransferase [Falseniella ignava]EKB55744.1 phosphoenolpyruvate-protein phosphotransferase [Falseniella ignava CCUG 37419]